MANMNDEILNIRADAQTGDLDKIDRQLRDTADSLNRLEGAGSDAEQGADKAESGFRRLMATAADLTLITGGMTKAFDLAKGVLNETVGAIFENQKAFNLLQAQTGATADEMAMFREEAEDVFLDNFGENMQDVVAAMSQVERVTQAGGDALEGMTADALLLRDVFEADVRESIQAADNMMNTFAISGEEAFDLLAAGFQATGDPGGDLLEVFTEYSPAFKRMGLSAKQAMTLLNQGLKGGARNTEFVADGLREFNTRLTDMSSKDAFIALGLENVFNAFQRGEIDAADAMEAVLNSLGDIDNEARRAALGAQLFGSKFEDMPGVFAALDLTSVSDEFQDVTNATENMTNAVQSGLGPAWERITRAGKMALTEALEPIVVALADKLVPIIEKAIPMFEKIGARLRWAFSLGKDEGIFEIKKILDELGLGTLAPLVDIADDAASTFKRLFDSFKEGGLKGLFDQWLDELKRVAPMVMQGIQDLAKKHIVDPLWAELKDPANWAAAGDFARELTGKILGKAWDAAGWLRTHFIEPAWAELTKRENWVMAGEFLRILVRDLLGKGWNAAEWIWSNVTSRMWNELTNPQNWAQAYDFLRRLTGEILGKLWTASVWVRQHVIEPLWNNLVDRQNWVNAGNFARELMGSIMGAFWDAGQWVRTNIIQPIQNAINNLIPSLNIPIPSIPGFGGGGSSGGGGGGLAAMVQTAASYANQINLSPAQFATYSGRLNYNSNYQGPRSIMRDSGGLGTPGQPYAIGLAEGEVFTPSVAGRFWTPDQMGGRPMEVTIPVSLDGREIARVVWREEERQYPGGRRRQ